MDRKGPPCLALSLADLERHFSFSAGAPFDGIEEHLLLIARIWSMSLSSFRWHDEKVRPCWSERATVAVLALSFESSAGGPVGFDSSCLESLTERVLLAPKAEGVILLKMPSVDSLPFRDSPAQILHVRAPDPIGPPQSRSDFRFIGLASLIFGVAKDVARPFCDDCGFDPAVESNERGPKMAWNAHPAERSEIFAIQR